MNMRAKPRITISTGIMYSSAIFIVYGIPGIGKTHLASSFSPRTLVLDLENGSKKIASAKRTNDVRIYDDLMWFLEVFIRHKDYDCLVIDSITALERMTVNHVVAVNGWKSIEDPGYGKGWSTYRAHLQAALELIEAIREAGKTVILVGHSTVRQVTDPSQAPHERVEYHIDQKTQPLLTSVVDACFYLRKRVGVMGEGKDKRTFTNNTRELITADQGGVLAKNRFSHLEEVIEFENIKDGQKVTEMYREFWKSVMQADEVKEELETEEASE